jgi:hypothetical protein
MSHLAKGWGGWREGGSGLLGEKVTTGSDSALLMNDMRDGVAWPTR